MLRYCIGGASYVFASSLLCTAVEIRSAQPLIGAKMSHTQISTPTTHAHEEARRLIVNLVSVLWVIGSIICPAPLLASGTAEGHGGSHDVDLPDEANHHAGTSCEIHGHSNFATAHSVDEQQRDHYRPVDNPPLAGLSTTPSEARFDLLRPRLPGTGPPRIDWRRFTQSWPNAPPV